MSKRYYNTKEDYIRLTLKLAKQGEGRTSPNPMVGCIIVKDGVIVGKGYHKKAGTPHAEINALQEAGHLSKGAELYVNLEPCNHFGRTPPCTESIIKAGISKVYVGMIDPNPKVSGNGIKRLLKAGIQVETGFLEEKCKRLNEVFIKYITTKIPFVTLKLASSLDGKIATSTKDSFGITSDIAKMAVHKLRDKNDAIMVGIGTVIADNPLLTCRIKGGKDPIRIIVDSNLSIPLESKILRLNSSSKTYIATLEKNLNLEKVKKLTEIGAEILFIEEKEKRVNLFSLFKKLGELEITSILVEGGAKIAYSLLKENLIDKFYFFFAPKIIGGCDSLGMFSGKGVNKINDSYLLKEIYIKKFGNEFLVEGYPNKITPS